MTFVDVLSTIRDGLSVDSALAAFCRLKWGEAPLSVEVIFRHRVELGLDKLPIIMLTAPLEKPGRYMDGEREYSNTVNLYAGFHQQDKEKAALEMIEFRELIEDALLSYRKNHSLPAGVEDINPGDSANDEGKFHPVYFLVKEITIDFTRSI